MPNTEPSSERIDEVAHELLGTCKSLESVITEEEFLNSKFLQALDEEVLECETCGWWCESGEMDEEGNCNDCSTEDDD